MNTEELRALVRKKWASPAWALFEEVGNSTGFGCSRHADAIAVSIWPSRGLSIQGLELKVSRSDWLRELKDPSKSEAIQQYCDFWFVIASDEKVVLPEELPANWGLLVAKGGRLSVKKQAPRLNPKQLDVGFVASLMRKRFDAEERIRLEALNKGFEDGVKNGPEHHARKVHELEREKENLEKRVREFEEASGIKLDSWRLGKIGQAARFIADSFLHGDFDERLGNLANRIAEISEDLSKCRGFLKVDPVGRRLSGSDGEEAVLGPL